MKRLSSMVVMFVGIFFLSSVQKVVAEDTKVRSLSVEERQILAERRQLWRPIQEEVKDTVVQVFSQIAEFDLLQPYRTPGQYGSRGSGFFINSDGYLVTNAHVVNQAVSVFIQIPSFGKRPIDVEVVGFCPERDLALLKLSDESLTLVRSVLGEIPYLKIGDSDKIRRSDEVLALGYPLGQQSLKSTTGVISGRESNLIQMSAPINPGSSGGPLLNLYGEVVGVNTAGVVRAQNIGYIIPSNDLTLILPYLRETKLLRKPFLGILSINGTDALAQFLGNPEPGGCYVAEVVKNSPLHKAGIISGDVIYSINGNPIDIYCEMTVPWSEDKISVMDYIHRLALGETVNLVYYRKGQRHEVSVTFDYAEAMPVRKMYPRYEEIDYEVFGGMVVMELTLNHIDLLQKKAPGITRFAEIRNQSEPTLVVTHIFANSALFRTQTINLGATLNEVNGEPVSTLKDFRNAIGKGKETGYFTIRSSDNVSRVSDNLFVVLPFDKMIQEVVHLSRLYRFPLSKTVLNLVKEFFDE